MDFLRIVLCIVGGFLLETSAWAQPVAHTDHAPTCLSNSFTTSDSSYLHKLHSWEKNVYRTQQASGNFLKTTADVEYTIPVVIHVIHNNGPENISDEQILAGIKHMNNAFAHKAPFNGTSGVDVGIKFCLARQDPDGNFTTGINRINSSLTNVDAPSQDLALKNLSRWDPTRYINIWLVNEICNGSQCAPGGYAYMAVAHGANIDGIVCEARWFGSSTDASKVHIHEMGHYLNLYHTFDNGCTNNDCLADGDQVCDTPPDASVYVTWPCYSLTNSCTSDEDDHSTNNPFRPVSMGGVGDQMDMFSNYMDYGAWACQNTFTQGQKERMVLALTTIRASLLNSSGCNSVCPNPITISFTVPSATVDAGSTVTFTNTTSGATEYKWFLDGIEYSTQQHIQYTFSTPGTYTVLLQAGNGNISCAEKFEMEIVVVCPVTADFSSVYSVLKDEPFIFLNLSSLANSYRWFVDDVEISTATDFTHTFSSSGIYNVTLIASNGICTDTIEKVVRVTDTQECVYGGREGYNWYFGMNAGINFFTDPPTSVINGQLATSEGCAVASDFAGNLLFYTNGVTVWNREHQVMVNGTALEGSNSATQSALTVPMPGSPEIYYVFTVDAAENRGQDGFRYSIIDLRLDDGRGAVTGKNVLLQAPVTEKQAAVRHGNGTDIWIVSRQFRSTRFWAYQLSSTGISASPVTSDVGTMDQVNSISNGSDAVGGMEISPDGTKIAFILRNLGAIELYDFDDMTGVISNPVLLPGLYYPYDVAFSPDNSKLYVSGDTLFQYDLSSGDPVQILQTQTFIYEMEVGSVGGSLQIGPDEKIYLARRNTTYLGCINAPNALGTSCNYVHDGVYLESPTFSSIGLPTFMAGYYLHPYPVKIEGLDRACANTSGHEYVISHGDFPITLEIFGGEILSFEDDTAIVSFDDIGSVALVASVVNCGKLYSDTFFIRTYRVIPPDLGADSLFCDDVFLPLDAGAYLNYLWQDGSTSRTFTATSPGTYYVTVTGAFSCKASDTIEITSITPPVIELKDTTICSNAILVLDAGAGYSDYVWEDGVTTTRTHTVFREGEYYVTATSICGPISDTCNVTLYSVPEVTFTIPGTMCEDDSAIFLTGVPSGGIFSGEGVMSDIFDPELAGEGEHLISYTYTTTDLCEQTNTQWVRVIESCEVTLFIPNLITPNNDGKNDYFEITGSSSGIVVTIFNRWGHQIYYSENYNNRWVGEDGVYYYEVVLPDGMSYKGWVNVVNSDE